MSTDDDMSRLSLLELFSEEAQMQTRVLSDGLLTLERASADAAALEACMRAAHSLKGAARIIGLQDGVDLANAMEECFVAAQRGTLALSAVHIDELLRGTDLLLRIADDKPSARASRAEIDACVAHLSGFVGAPAAMGAHEASANMSGDALPAAGAESADALLSAAIAMLQAQAQTASAPAADPAAFGEPGFPSTDSAAPVESGAPRFEREDEADPRGSFAEPATSAPAATQPPSPATPSAPAPARATQAGPNAPRDSDRILRVRADNLDRLLSLSGESLVESRWLKPFAESMLRVKRTQREAARALDTVYESLAHAFDGQFDARASAALDSVRDAFGAMQQQLATQIDELDRYDRRSTNLAQQLYDEALQCRMRAFGDATHVYPRIVRDLARSLGKQVRFSIVGEATQVDRDILDMLDAPLGHLLRNALDHGIETPDERVARGKPPEASLTLEARHSAGKLLISVSDDGRGIELDGLRAAIVRRQLADEATAARLSELELLEFLLLPGFSMRAEVTDVSGRGVGLDAVHDMVKAVRGTVRMTNEPGSGMRFVLQLPLTLSVIRSLLVEVGGEAYAFPLAHVHRTLTLARADIEMLEGQQHFSFEGRRVGLVSAQQLLGLEAGAAAAEVAVVVLGDERATYGVAVERFLGERMLVVQPLDARLGKIKDIAAAALMDNGAAVLIIDVDDLLRSVDKLVREGQLARVRASSGTVAVQRKQVLIVEDSLTVRELERKLLEKRGYAVTVAVDGMDGWNALRGASFDLVVTDIDMPRMDGIELVTMIRRDPQLKSTPVMIVSYKDRDEDRRRGLDAGADYYLAKGSFHDEALLDAVHDLIGEANR
jgi:two-component system, chemotaxis family, sensor histidine kinase and response regulator WspE